MSSATYPLVCFLFSTMIIIDNFKLYHTINSENEELIYVLNDSPHPCCPYCQHPMGVKGNTKRVWWLGNGECRTLVIRKLRCSACEKGHHELPNFLVPYKRYDADTIQAVLTTPSQSCEQCVSDSTISRWRASFSSLAPYYFNALLAIFSQLNQRMTVSSKPTPLHPFLPFIHFFSPATNWLALLVQCLVNSNIWP